MNAMGGKLKNEKKNVTIESGFHFLLKVVSVSNFWKSWKHEGRKCD
jgi:hypothetical protein